MISKHKGIHVVKKQLLVLDVINDALSAAKIM
jgi:hypothetical protein